MKQTKLFQVTITESFKKELEMMAKSSGYDYGVFFTTSGKAKLERVRPSAMYDYLFRTNVYTK